MFRENQIIEQPIKVVLKNNKIAQINYILPTSQGSKYPVCGMVGKEFKCWSLNGEHENEKFSIVCKAEKIASILYQIIYYSNKLEIWRMHENLFTSEADAMRFANATFEKGAPYKLLAIKTGLKSLTVR